MYDSDNCVDLRDGVLYYMKIEFFSPKLCICGLANIYLGCALYAALANVFIERGVRGGGRTAGDGGAAIKKFSGGNRIRA